jgi:Methyltransferase domain
MNNRTFLETRAVSPMSGSESRPLFQHEVLGKYLADYYYDEKISYIFVRKPYWLHEAYSDAISSMDTGILARNISNIDVISKCLSKNRHHCVINGIDLGAGYGLFVRGMRDRGVDFYWSDKFADNLVARGFEAECGKEYSVAVAFEVLEHLANPIDFLHNARREFRFHTCFFSALCFDEQKLPDTDWWYWAFEGGQHISFFSRRALLWMAEQLEMRLWNLQGDVFAFSKLEWKPLIDNSRKLVRLRNRLNRILLPQRTTIRESLTWSDHIKVRDKFRNN